MQDYDRLVFLAYGSLAGADARREFISSLCSATRSHIVALQLDDQGAHYHNVLSHFDSEGNAFRELDDLRVPDEIYNPWFVAEAADRLLKIGVNCDNGLIESSAFKKTDFYQVVLRPVDVFHSMGLLLSVSPGKTSLLTVSRSSKIGHFDHDDLSLAMRLVPHLRNLQQIQSSIQIDQQIRCAQQEPSWLLDKFGRVIVSFSGNELIERALKEVRGFLQPILSQDRERFSIALRKVICGATLCERVLIRDRNGYPAVVLRLQFAPPPLFQSWLLTAPPAILVFARHVAQSVSDMEVAVRSLFGLTCAEARVVKMLYENYSVREISARTGRSVDTIRCQLKSIFQKTETKGQLQLLRLIETVLGP